MAIPTASTSAPAIVMPVFCIIAPAKVTPTAIPSGRLCSVTASTSIVVLRKPDFTPSGFSLSICRWGTRLSSSRRNPMPSKNPAAAGSQLKELFSSDISMAGISSDQTEAAIITPEANPRSSFSSLLFISCFMKNTMAEPKVVPKKGIKSTIISFIFFIPFYSSFLILFFFLFYAALPVQYSIPFLAATGLFSRRKGCLTHSIRVM